jgi:PRC-barrel domain
MPDLDTVLGWRGKTVRDREGEKLGTLGALYLDADTDLPAYAGVHTGLFRRHESVVPLDDAQEVDGDIRLPYDADTVREAPNVDPDVALDDDEQAKLHEHYGTTNTTEAPEVIRSEEEVRVEPGPMQPRERVRLKKYLVTDYVEKTVPVRREEVRIEHDPPA